MTNPLQGTCIH